jgi:hypothetical protein
MSNDEFDAQQRLKAARTMLEDLQSGKLITGVIGGEGWRHTTERDIERKKEEIASYERVLGDGLSEQ